MAPKPLDWSVAGVQGSRGPGVRGLKYVRTGGGGGGVEFRDGKFDSPDGRTQQSETRGGIGLLTVDRSNRIVTWGHKRGVGRRASGPGVDKRISHLFPGPGHAARARHTNRIYTGRDTRGRWGRDSRG